MDFSDNPYESPVIVAELAQPIRKPVNRRSPILAMLFLFLSLPFVAMTIGMWWINIASPPQNIRPVAFWVMAFAPLAAFTFAVWWIPYVAIRELVQWLRGR